MCLDALIGGLLAGLLISIGGTVSLSVNPISAIAGAVLFTVGLIAICIFGFYLFTGKVGYLAEDHSFKNIRTVLSGLGGNLIATLLCGTLVGLAKPALIDAAKNSVSAKLSVDLWRVLILAFFCGVLMYIAVHSYKMKGTCVGILFCVPVFILSGFEHSIADMFYFALARSYTWASLAFIAVVVVGNAIGALAVSIPYGFVTRRKK